MIIILFFKFLKKKQAVHTLWNSYKHGQSTNKRIVEFYNTCSKFGKKRNCDINIRCKA